MKPVALIAALAVALPDLVRVDLVGADLVGADLVGAQIGIPVETEIVILGEVHDNPEHHTEQARLVASITPSALVWEMLDQTRIDAAGTVDQRDGAAFGAALGWEDAGWPDFAMYHPIFLAAGEVPHIGAAVARADLRRAMNEGAAAVTVVELAPLSPDRQAMLEAEQARAHCDALPADLLPGMVEAQRLRDAAMAEAALRALADHGPPVVIITGTGHARTDTGIPAILQTAAPEVRVWSLGQVEGDAGPAPPFDAVNATPPLPRSDPCAGLASP